MTCPECGATDQPGPEPLDGMLDSWQDATHSGWQCHNLACLWFGVAGEVE